MFASCNQGYQRSGNTCTASLVGKFRSPCYDSGGVDVHYTNNFIDDSKHQLIGTVFYNPGAPNTCTTGYRQVIQNQTYARINESPYVAGAVEVDFSKVNLTITLLSDLAVADHNAIAYCGFTGWQKNVAYNFAYAACNIPAGVVKTINQVKGDTLYVGDFISQKLVSGKSGLDQSALRKFKKICYSSGRKF